GARHRERRAADEPHRARPRIPGPVAAGRCARLDRGVRQVAEVHARVEAPEAVELVVADGDVRGVDRTHDARPGSTPGTPRTGERRAWPHPVFRSRCATRSRSWRSPPARTTRPPPRS